MNKKLLYALGGVCLAAAALFGGKVWYEGKIRSDIEAALSSLSAPLTAKAARIDVSILDKAVTLTGLTGEYADANGKVTYTVASAAARGIAFDAFKDGAGTVKLADNLVLRDVTVTSPLITARIASYALSDIRGDYAQMRNAMAQVLPDLMLVYTDPDFATDPAKSAAFLGRLGSLMQASETFSVGNFAAENYGYTLAADNKKVDCLVEQITATEYSLRKMGPMAMRNISVSMEGKSLFQIAAVAMDEATLPSFVKLFDVLGKQTAPTPELLRQALGGQPFNLKNLRVTNMRLFDPEHDGAKFFTLDAASLSYDAGETHTMDFAYNGLAIAKEAMDQADLPEKVLARLGDAVTLEGGTSLRVTPGKDGASDVAYRTKTQSAQLGEAILAIELENLSLETLDQGMAGPVALKGFDLTLTDKGASEILFIIDGENTGKTPEEARAGNVAALLSEREGLPNDAVKSLVDALADFIKEPGKSLRIALAPEKPLRFAEIQAAVFMLPEKLGLTATVSPAQ